MNFLAHLALSDNEAVVQAGNLFGDEVKGRDYSHLPSKVAMGVTLHRFIDSHADSDERNLTTKKMLYPVFHKYAGVALDIYYDHFLAKNWSIYMEDKLEQFSSDVYVNLEPYLVHFSEQSHRLFQNMSKHNWLVGYGTMEGMRKTFDGMSKMLPENSGMNEAFSALEKHYDDLEDSYNEYFPDLWNDTREKLLALRLIEKLNN